MMSIMTDTATAPRARNLGCSELATVAFQLTKPSSLGKVPVRVVYSCPVCWSTSRLFAVTGLDAHPVPVPVDLDTAHRCGDEIQLHAEDMANQAYRDVARTLREISDRLAALADCGSILDAPQPYVHVSIMPGYSSSLVSDVTPEQLRTNRPLIDTVATALLGRAAGDNGAADTGGRRWGAREQIRPSFWLNVHDIVPDERLENTRAELVQTLAELERANAALAQAKAAQLAAEVPADTAEVPAK